eukprot:CAMPEP_0115042168 /NCGR_PEP_ID=MMETSP0216-20121206/46114_1 /TAXON_ID=223996 /ORGANISM="Protocruzia adherens, Strain Boccale" /LENGTH=312 /DNA_ID=CAMNT_0002424249 /DNA_START=304 /DNA_END=1242 /DNA_ORIENTATION=-
MGPTYNHGYLFDCLLLLDTILLKGYDLHHGAAVNNSIGYNAYVGYYDRECMDKLKNALDTVTTESRYGLANLLQMQFGEIRFETLLKDFLKNVREAHGVIDTDLSRSIYGFIQELEFSLEAKLKECMESPGQGSYYTNFTLPIISDSGFTFEIRCFSSVNFPNGDNRVLEISKNLPFSEVKAKVEEKYQFSPLILQYIDDHKEQITIDDERIFRKALKRAQADAYDVQSSTVELRLIVVYPQLTLTNQERNYLAASSPIYSPRFSPGRSISPRYTSRFVQCIECGSQFIPLYKNADGNTPMLCQNCSLLYSY